MSLVPHIPANCWITRLKKRYKLNIAVITPAARKHTEITKLVNFSFVSKAFSSSVLAEDFTDCHVHGMASYTFRHGNAFEERVQEVVIILTSKQLEACTWSLPGAAMFLFGECVRCKLEGGAGTGWRAATAKAMCAGTLQPTLLKAFRDATLQANAEITPTAAAEAAQAQQEGRSTTSVAVSAAAEPALQLIQDVAASGLKRPQRDETAGGSSSVAGSNGKRLRTAGDDGDTAEHTLSAAASADVNSSAAKRAHSSSSDGGGGSDAKEGDAAAGGSAATDETPPKKLCLAPATDETHAQVMDAHLSLVASSLRHNDVHC
jgi:hypothetical protein